MKIVFFGTPAYVLPVLETLHKKFKSKNGASPIEAVVTQPPRPVGRKHLLSYSPIDTWAHKHGIRKFFSPNELPVNNIKADVGVLASYGEILPEKLIKYFPYGIINIHPSLLPSWRGSAPVQATIISGTQAGASFIKLDEKLDHGPIISQFKDEVRQNDTTQTLRDKLFIRSSEVLTTLLPAYIAGKIKPHPQDDSKATYTREIKKADGFIPPEYLNATLQGLPLQGKWKIDFIKGYSPVPNASCLDSFIRAMQPWPVAWTYVQLDQSTKSKDQRRLKILEAHVEKLVPNASCLVPDLVQLEGKNPVSWKQFRNGYPEAKFSQ